MEKQINIKKFYKEKNKNIKVLNHWSLIISGALTAITLFITWIVFISFYRSNVNELLQAINNNGLNFNFVTLSLLMYIFILLFIGLLVFLFVFFKKNNLLTFTSASISLIVSIMLLMFIIIFLVLVNKGIPIGTTKHAINNILIFIIPSIFTTIFVSNVIGFSCLYIVSSFPKKMKSVFLNQQKIIKGEQSKFNNHLYDHNTNISEDEKTLTFTPQAMQKNHDEIPNVQSLENNRLQAQPGSNPVSFTEKIRAETIELQIKKQLDENHRKLNYNRDPIAIKAEEKHAVELENNKKNVFDVNEKPVLKAQVSQPLPLHEEQKNKYVKDVTFNPYQEPKIMLNDDAQKIQDMSHPQSNNEFVQNVYPSNPHVHDVTSSFTNNQSPVLKIKVSQPLNPQSIKPQPQQVPKKPNAPLKVWTNEQINRAWERGLIVDKYEPEAYRSDYAGALMFKDSFVANPNNEENNNVRSYSWTIVYERPLWAAGSEEPSNLWPLNCVNALAKGDNYPKWKTTVTFNGVENVIKEKKWKGKRRIAKKNKK